MFTIEKNLTQGKAYRCVQDDLKYDRTLLVKQGNNEVTLTSSDLQKLLSLDYAVQGQILNLKRKKREEEFRTNLPKLIEKKKQSYLNKPHSKKIRLYQLEEPFNGNVLCQVRGTWEDVVNFAFSKKTFLKNNYNYCEIVAGAIRPVEEPKNIKVINLQKDKK